jgi:tetratricopeptide (TPR) repeat protein
MMTFSSRSFDRVFASAAVALLVALFFGAGAVHAQSSDGNQPEYAGIFNEAKQTAQQGMQAQQSDDIDGAVAKYEAAYKQMDKAAGMAKNEGDVENANMIQGMAAKLAYRAGSLLHNNDQSQAAIVHFEFGQQIAPAGYTKNTTGLKAARSSLKQGPIVDASRALRAGNPARTLELLSGLDEQTSTSYFYQALAHQKLGNNESVVANAGRALDTGGLSTSKERRLYLVIGEAHMKMGESDPAREALTQAADLGSDRAEALMKQL